MDVMTAAALTVRTLQRTVPAAVPGIMFLSGESKLVTSSKPMPFPFPRVFSNGALAWECRPHKDAACARHW